MDSSRLIESGFEFDRQWIVVNDEWKMVTQRQLPRMVLIQPSLSTDALRLTAPDCESIEVSLRSTGGSRTVRVWDDTVAGLDEGDAVSQWLSSFLGASVRLLRKDPSKPRIIDHPPSNYTPQTQFSDGYQLHLISKESLDDINSRSMASSDPNPVSHRNFRPNILVTGCSQAFQEDEWSHIRIGSCVFHVVSLVTRCTIPSNNTETGQMGSQPTKLLQSYRRVDPSAKYKSVVGISLVHDSLGLSVAIGDSLEISDDPFNHKEI